MTVELSVLVPEQWERLREIRIRAMEDSPKSFGSTLDIELARTKDEWLEYIERGTWFIAGDFRGMAAGFVREESGHNLNSMWVEPGLRGSGVATRLMDAVIDWARTDGADVLYLWVGEHSTRARRAYERAGFEPTGESAVFKKTGVMGIRMSLTLRA